MPLSAAQLTEQYILSEFPSANYTAPWHPTNTQLIDWMLPHSTSINYTFNKYGFRGTWTISELTDSIWCFGDSQTLGLGVDISDTWVSKLETITNIKTINFGIAGASNDTITRTLLSALHHGPKPKAVCVLLTDTDRRETICEKAKITLFPQVHIVLPSANQELFRQYAMSIDNISNQINYDKNLLLIQAYTKDIPAVIANFTKPMWETAQSDLAHDGYHIGTAIHSAIAEYFGSRLS